MEQPQYNMFHRDRVEVEYSQIYKTVGLGTTIWSPLCSGVLTEKYLNGFPDEMTRLSMEGLDWLRDRSLSEARIAKVRELKKLADEMGTTVPKLAIAWCALNPNVSTVILGASKETHLTETLTSLDLLSKFDDTLINKIELILGNTPRKPDF
jgi:aryl-alcohol dehydrogenase-like predicted oxidoreductase